jgi:hypothetical protein
MAKVGTKNAIYDFICTYYVCFLVVMCMYC